MAPLPPREQRHPFFRYQGLEYTDADIADFKERLERIYGREIHMFQLGRARRRLSWRQFILALGLHTGEKMESPGFARTSPFLDFDQRSGVETLPSDDGTQYCWEERFAAGRKSGAHISGGQFVARLAEHFGLLTAEILGGLTAIAPELPIIDMGELVRLQIFAEDALAADEGDQAVLAPVQAPQQPPPPPPPAAARTMP
ncbi:hypothetical protein Tco_1351248 [Tanacetum coccineum]